MALKYFAFYILIKMVTAAGNFPSVPCPDTFKYSWDGQRYYGIITINNFYSNQVILEVKLAQNRAIDKGNFGQLLFDQDQSSFPEGCFIYRVEFPFQNEFPAINRIILNGNIICESKSPEVISARQTITLVHSLNFNFPKETNLVPKENSFVTNTLAGRSAPSNQNQPKGQQNGLPIIQPSNQQNSLRMTTLHQSIHSIRSAEILRNRQAQAPVQSRAHSEPEIEEAAITEHHQQEPPRAAGKVKTQQVERNNVSQDSSKEKIASGLFCNFLQRISETPNDLPKNTKFPWVAGIFRKGLVGLNYTCDGSLISAHTVVTSAECLETNMVTSDNAVIFLGWNLLDYSNDSEVVIREAERIIVHPDFYKNGTDNEDIALMQLKKPISFTQNIHPICLWSDYSTNKKRRER